MIENYCILRKLKRRPSRSNKLQNERSYSKKLKLAMSLAAPKAKKIENLKRGGKNN